MLLGCRERGCCFTGGGGVRFRLRDVLDDWREGAGCVVDSHMFQHVSRRLKGTLTNFVHAHFVPAIVAYHKSTACNPSRGYVHASSLRFNGGQCRALGQQPQTLVTAAFQVVIDFALRVRWKGVVRLRVRVSADRRVVVGEGFLQYR